jgi:phosphoribosylglycinamide formyltransferase-1
MTIGIFASGKGSNAENIIRYFHNTNHKIIIFTNNEDAGVIEIAWTFNVNCIIFNKYEKLINILDFNQIDFIVLAGYTKIIPPDIIEKYENRIINIHPSLLPKYGGKGMWGMNVHKSVIENKEKESGITIHYVSENYDEGRIIEQHKLEVLLCDTPETLAKKISQLEREHFPKCIKRLISFF